MCKGYGKNVYLCSRNVKRYNYGNDNCKKT